MLVERALRLVEGDLGQRPLLDGREQLDVVLEMPLAVRGARGEAGEVVEGLVMRREPGSAVGSRLDHAARPLRRLHTVLEGHVPCARVPRPRDALRGERVADGLLRLRGESVACGIGAAAVAVSGWRHAARLTAWRRGA